MVRGVVLQSGFVTYSHRGSGRRHQNKALVLLSIRHGFRRGHGTDSALMVHINCLEHARLTNSPLFLSSWDIRRAFDSVSKEAMDASWRRLGVPADTAHWIAHLDD